MAADVAIGIAENLQRDFVTGIKNNDSLQELMKKAKAGRLTYSEASEAARMISKISVETMGVNITPEVLPDGRMYFNIAERTVRPLIEQSYDAAAELAQSAQQAANPGGLKAIKPTISEDRVSGIINRLTDAEQFADIKWILGAPVEQLITQSVVDCVRENADFQARSGLQPLIIRTMAANCCSWCARLEGVYRYPQDVRKEVWQRHDNCNCEVAYKANSSDEYQNVWTKQKFTDKLFFEEEGKALRLERVNAMNKYFDGNAEKRKKRREAAARRRKREREAKR